MKRSKSGQADSTHAQIRWKLKSSKNPANTISSNAGMIIGAGKDTWEDSSTFSNLYRQDLGTLSLIGVPISVGISSLRSMLVVVKDRISHSLDDELRPAVTRYDSILNIIVLSAAVRPALTLPLPAKALNQSYLMKLLRKYSTPLLLLVANERTPAALEYQKQLMNELLDSYGIQAADLCDEMRNLSILQNSKKPKDKDEYEMLFLSAPAVRLRQLYNPEGNKRPVVVSISVEEVISYMLTVYEVSARTAPPSPTNRIKDLVQSADASCLTADINVDVGDLRSAIASTGRQRNSSRLNCLQRQLKKKILSNVFSKSVPTVRNKFHKSSIDAISSNTSADKQPSLPSSIV